jgi:hypothetical protein
MRLNVRRMSLRGNDNTPTSESPGHVNSAFERDDRACRMIAVAEDGPPNRAARLLGWVRQNGNGGTSSSTVQLLAD